MQEVSKIQHQNSNQYCFLKLQKQTKTSLSPLGIKHCKNIKLQMNSLVTLSFLVYIIQFVLGGVVAKFTYDS